MRKLKVIIPLALALMLLGCNNPDDNQPAKKVYNHELASYFPSEEQVKLNYFGTAEYGHYLTLEKISESTDSLNLYFRGEIHDMSDGEGGFTKEQMEFENEYIIGKDSIREVQKNHISKTSQSIIRDFTILKLPLEAGNSWAQTATIDGEQYIARTTITEVSNDPNKSIIKTETSIEGLDGYPNNTYKETRAYKKGFGIQSLYKVILLNNVDNPTEYIPFEFGYTLYEHE